jgi:hypothetical protein
MSSLIFHTDASQALVATDTLAVKPDGTPLMYGSKALYLPHLKTIIAGNPSIGRTASSQLRRPEAAPCWVQRRTRNTGI